jgi:protein-L-isoaspartate(D-aspartate) O-methyltransferase
VTPGDSLPDRDRADERLRMVTQQLERRGIRDRRVLEAMAAVPRERFVPAESRHLAYADGALAIGHGQTISQPYMVARSCELAALAPEARVLEVGAGSGYQAAVLGRLAAEVSGLVLL